MRLGVLADIHGNLHALEAVLEALEHEGVDHHLCLGDLVGYGPLPNECIALVERLGARCVAGNHDLIALGRLPDEGIAWLARDTLQWTRRVLTDDVLRFLDRLPGTLEFGGVVMAHGALGDPTRYVRRPTEAAVQLGTLARERPAARFLLLGHTHRQAVFIEGGEAARTSSRSLSLAGVRRALLNPGSVGQSRQRTARARFMVLDLERDEATFHTRRYDVEGCLRALRSAGLPPGAVHVKPTPLRTLAGALRRRVATSSS